MKRWLTFWGGWLVVVAWAVIAVMLTLAGCASGGASARPASPWRLEVDNQYMDAVVVYLVEGGPRSHGVALGQVPMKSRATFPLPSRVGVTRPWFRVCAGRQTPTARCWTTEDRMSGGYQDVVFLMAKSSAWPPLFAWING